jgi:hypothetical protein
VIISLSSPIAPGAIIHKGYEYFEVHAVCLGGLGQTSYINLRPVEGSKMPNYISAEVGGQIRGEDAFFTVPLCFLVGCEWWPSAIAMAASTRELVNSILVANSQQESSVSLPDGSVFSSIRRER